jgi:tetratricopeptide (TPR) repeat protein
LLSLNLLVRIIAAMNILKRFDKKYLFMVLGAVLIVAGASFYFYYSSESKMLERLSKDNPRGEEFIIAIKEAQNRLIESKDSKSKIEALIDIAIAKTALGDLKGATSNYKEVLKFNPIHSIVHENLASIYVNQFEYEKAETEYLTIIATQSHLIDPYLRLADLYEAYIPEKENMVPAVLTFGINQNGKQPALLERLVRYYFDKELYWLAGEQADELLEIDSNNSFAEDVLKQIEAKS